MKNCIGLSEQGNPVVFATSSRSSHRLLGSPSYTMLIFTQQSPYSMDNHFPVDQAQKSNTHISSKEGFRSRTSCSWMKNTGIEETKSDWRCHRREQRRQCSQKKSQTSFYLVYFTSELAAVSCVRALLPRLFLAIKC